jgi:tRNA (guanine-N7-)-methyltransferase
MTRDTIPTPASDDDTAGTDRRTELDPAEIAGGRQTLPPGQGRPRERSAFVNPYIVKLAEYPDLILEGPAAEAYRGRWMDAFDGTDRPLVLEVGSGNGFFLRGMCQRHPDWRFIGVEIRYKRVWMAARKLSEVGCTNGRVVLHHGGYLARLFADGSLHQVHLNHPDPWPKDRHARNRIITPDFLALVTRLLAPGGLFQIKSDCARYADDARAAAEGTGLTEEAYAADLHQPGEPLAEGNIVTNYERKFMEKDEPVFLQRWRKGC